MRLVLDVENTITTRGGKIHGDPYETGNYLVQVGIKNVDRQQERHVLNFNHDEQKDTKGTAFKLLQAFLDETTLLIMHNAQHDLPWIWESGFKYSGLIYDTMLAEYVLLRGQKYPLSLEGCADRRELSHRKGDTLKRYYRDGFNTNQIPLAELSEYLISDLDTTCDLFHDQGADYAKPESASLIKIRDITNEVCVVLSRMYMDGIKVDRPALAAVRELFERELADIETRLQAQVRHLMGATPINLNSPEQMSQVVFSRKVNNKKEWVDLFNFTKTPKEFKDAVSSNTTAIRKTEAYTCPTCDGAGRVFKTKKDGSKFKKPNHCKECESRGFKLKELNELAGLKFSAPSKEWVTANGFGTGKDNLTILIATAKNNGMTEAMDFMTDLRRMSAVSSYLSSFVEGIDVYTKDDGLLHVSLTQHITATGRFSGRNPNMQNMPRGGTFPVKRVFISRWDGGEIMEADFAQLEFRTAAFLSQDVLAMAEIADGFDVHSYTAKVITDAGQPTTRQAAKEHTFAPLFGATGYGRSKAEEAYYIHFNKKYEGIAAWHKKLGDEAIRFQKITNVSGRQYAFPDVTRRANGSPTHFTMIKNYPVQGFATGDVVPVVILELDRRLAPYQSCLVNTVHDSTVIDIHPEERAIVIGIIDDLNTGLNKLVMDAYGIEMNVPLLLEAKIGPNWLDTKDV